MIALPAGERSAAERLLAGEGPLARAVAVALVVAFTLCIALVPIRADNDCWWHVKSGQVIAERGLPSHDVFSFAAADYEWHNHEWLAQSIMWRVYEAGERTSLGGWRAVILGVGVVLAATFALVCLLAGRISGNWWVALLIAVAAVAVSRRTFSPRPPVISYLFVVAEIGLLSLVQDGQWGRRALLLLLPLFALWANLHGGWLAGLVILAAYVGQDIVLQLRRLLPIPLEPSSAPIPFPFSALVLFGAVAATLCNPYGWKLYLLPARVMGDVELVRRIGEMRSPDMYFTIEFEVLVVWTIILLAFVARRHRPRLGDLVVFAFFLHQALQHVRHLPLFACVMWPLLARAGRHAVAGLGDWLDEVREFRRWVVGVATLVVALCLSAYVVLNPREGTGEPFAFSGSYPRRNAQYLGGTDYVRSAFPADACDFIEDLGLKGRLFNEDWYAGYLIWRLAPETMQVFSDPRFDIFGGAIWRQQIAISGAADATPEMPGWRELLDHWKVEAAMTTVDTPLATKLAAADSGWRKLADWSPRGQGWILFLRDTPANAAGIARARAMAASRGLGT